MVSELGDMVLSSTSIASNIVMLANTVISALGVGLSIFAAQYFGVKNMKGIAKSFGIAIGLSALIILPLVLGSVLFPSALIRLFNQEPGVVEPGTVYLRIVCISFPATIIAHLLSVALQATGRVKIPTVSAMISMAVNVIGNYLLIGGHLGFPALGVRGAAIATVIAAWANPLCIVLFSIGKKTVLSQPLKDFFRFKGKDLLVFLKPCIPVFLNLVLYKLGHLIMTAIYSNLNYENTASLAITGNVIGLIWAVHGAMKSAASIMVGQKMGAGKIKEAKRDAWRLVWIEFVAASVLSVLIYVFRNQIIQLFNLSDGLSEKTQQMALLILIFEMLLMPIRQIVSLVMDAVFPAGGNTVISAVLDTISMWLVAVGGTALTMLVLKWDFVTSYVLIQFAETIPKGILVFAFFLSDKWMTPVT